MGIIRLLDDKTINKIAAGEVIEKPASIVKELVENSIDAGADEIGVEISGGGISLIRITDNGKGIDRDDMEIAFQRHATSKIISDSDLYNINTLGFRGEALASIAAVSRVEMISKQRDSSIGYSIEIEGGRITEKKESGSPDGTIITVKDVFFNTPARLKFLKTTSREGMYITEIMQNLALSHPDISFKYKQNDKMVFMTKGDGDIKSIMLSIYGREVVNNVIEVNYFRDLITIKGYIGNANVTKNNRNHQSIFVNGRFIRNKTITAAVEAAFKSMITINKFPMYVLNIYTNPEFIDVNVHPAKSEIKFQDDQIIFKHVFHCVKEALVNISPILETEEKKESNFISNIPKINHQQIGIDYEAFEYRGNAPTGTVNIISEDTADHKKTEVFKHDGINRADRGENYFKNGAADSYHNKNRNVDSEESNKGKTPKFNPLAVVGQIHFTYIVAEGSDEMYLIDQHAAHERIYYERYMDEYNKFSIQSQNLIVPAVLDLSLSEKQMAFDNEGILKRFGYEVEDFGGNAIALRCIPVIYGNPDNSELFHEILNTISSPGRELKGSDIINEVTNKVLYTMACKSAIKAGDKLNIREMEELIERLRYCDNPFTCPHGRPTIIKMSYTELEKKFKRIQ